MKHSDDQRYSSNKKKRIDDVERRATNLDIHEMSKEECIFLNFKAVDDGDAFTTTVEPTASVLNNVSFFVAAKIETITLSYGLNRWNRLEWNSYRIRTQCLFLRMCIYGRYWCCWCTMLYVSEKKERKNHLYTDDEDECDSVCISMHIRG